MLKQHGMKWGIFTLSSLAQIPLISGAGLIMTIFIFSLPIRNQKT
jgi:hypothetical protein